MARDATAPELGGGYVRVGQLADLQGAECVAVHVKEHTLALDTLSAESQKRARQLAGESPKKD